MILDTGTLIAITIALAAPIVVMFWKQNIEMQKEIRRLQVALRTERRKTK